MLEVSSRPGAWGGARHKLGAAAAIAAVTLVSGMQGGSASADDDIRPWSPGMTVPVAAAEAPAAQVLGGPPNEFAWPERREIAWAPKPLPRAAQTPAAEGKTPAARTLAAEAKPAPVRRPVRAARAGEIRSLASFTAARQAKSGPQKLYDELHCLALNIYFEARGEDMKGQHAVAHVVMNRVKDARFPHTVCDVVRQGGEATLHRCQFSWWCDGQSDRPRNLEMWKVTQAIARSVYWGYSADPTQGALWYHADYVMPHWGKVFKRGPTIGRHIFYVADERGIYLAQNSVEP